MHSVASSFWQGAQVSLRAGDKVLVSPADCYLKPISE